MQAQANTLSGTKIGPYLLHDSIAAGGMGEVYRATDTRLGRQVAVKAIHPHLVANELARKRFLRETQLACRVNHPYVASVFDVVEWNRQPLLVMELIAGRPLSTVLRTAKPSVTQVWRWMVEVVDALAAIHRAGVVHRDLKPGNIMVTRDDHIKVMDFGLSTLDPLTRSDPDAPTATRLTSLTDEGAILGTLLYMSPEQVRGGTIDRRSDLFSLGILMYEALRGAHPFVRATSAESITAILHDPPSGGALPPAINPGSPLDALLSRLLHKAPEKRYSDADSLLADMQTLSADLVEAPPVGLARLARFAAFAILLLLALAAAGLWWLSRPPVWSAPRYAIAVAPFEDRSGSGEGTTAAAMVSDLLTVDLQASRIVRASGPTDLELLLSSLPEDPRPTEVAVRLASALKLDFVVLGKLFRDGDAWVATVDVEACKPDLGRVPSIRASGPTALAVAERLAARLRSALPGVSRLQAYRDDRTNLAEITSASEEARSLLTQGLTALREQRLNAAIDLFRQATEVDPLFSLGFVQLTEALHLAGFGRLAREAAARAVDLAPSGRSRAERRLALSARAARSEVLARPLEVIDSTEELLQLFPDEPALLRRHAEALSSTGRYTEALGFMDRALLMDPLSPAIRLSRAEMLIAEGNAEAALTALDEVDPLILAVRSEEGRARSERFRGRALVGLERAPEAIARLSEAARRYEGAGREAAAAETALEVAGIQLALGEIGQASEQLDHARALGERLGNRKLIYEALSLRAVLRQLQRDYEGAVSQYAAAVDLARQLENPTLVASPLANMTSLLVWLGRRDEAEPLLAETIEVARETARGDILEAALINSAEIDYHTARLDEAARHYQDLLSQAGDSPGRLASFAFLGLAAIARDQGRLTEALAWLDRGVVLYRDRGMKAELGRALINRARAAALLGRREQSLEDLASADALAVELPELQLAALAARAESALDRGDPEEALRLVTGRSGWRTEPLLLTVACDAHGRLGDVRRALEACKAMLASAGPAPSNRMRVRALEGEWHLLARNTEEAATAASEVLETSRPAGLKLAFARATAIAAATGSTAACAEGAVQLSAYLDATDPADRAAVESRPDFADISNKLAANCPNVQVQQQQGG